MEILFFLTHQPDPRFINQINYLSKNNSVTLVFFHRKVLKNLNHSIDDKVVMYDLGELPNASKPFKRVGVYFTVIGKIKKLFNKNDFNVVIFNNIDSLLLYLFSKISFSKKKVKAKIAIEVSDLRKFVFGDSLIHKTARFLERKLYKKYVNKLIVTSLKYYTYHFENFYSKQYFVLENKMLSTDVERRKEGDKVENKKTIIGIVGLLLRKKEYIKLFEVYKNDTEVEIHIHGKGEYQSIVEDYADKYENITYFGSYNTFKDTRKIYASLDVIYLVYDAQLVSQNNRLALPNKLYECMHYRVPILCSKNTYLEEYVLEYGIGVGINYKEKDAIKNGVKYLKDNKEKMNEIFEKIPESSFFGDQDYIKFENFLQN